MENKRFYPMLCALLNSSIRWIQITTAIENRNKTIKEISNTNAFELDNLDESNPFNPGILMASAYLLFVYPHEHESDKYLSNNMSCFTVEIGKSDNLQRRLRNAISHGRYKFLDGNIIEFTDIDSKGKNKVVFKISMSKFGNFLNTCLTRLSTVK